MDNQTSTRQHLAFTAQNLTLATKLFAPPITDGWIQRPHLVDRLNAGLTRKLTLISAPAGYGKTALLSEWRAFTPDTERRPIAWLSLDTTDNDPSGFMLHLIAALQTVEPSIGQGLLYSLQGSPTPTPRLQMTALINEISTLPYQFVLILDDYHTLTDDDIHQSINFLLDNLPPQIHIIITTRTEPPLPLARLRANRAINEFTTADLRFTPTEITSFLHQTFELDLSPAHIQTLTDRTEGWIAAIQLIAHSLGTKSDPAAHISTISGQHHHLTDYFTQEILAQQSPQIRHFLLQTAILERFCAPLCQALTNDPDSPAIINHLLDNNLFITPLDDDRTWFRYHHLFADHLRAQLAQEQGHNVDTLYRQASKWCTDHHLETEAIRYALQSGDDDFAADLILAAGSQKLKHGQLTTLITWLDALSPEHLAQNPQLSLLYAWTLEHTCVMEGVEPHLQNVENALNNPDFSPAEQNAMQGEIAALRARIAVLNRDYDQAITYSHDALALIPPNDFELRAAVNFQLALAYNVIDDVESMQPILDDVIADARTVNNWRTLCFAANYRIQLYQLQGHLHRALDMIRQIESWAEADQAYHLPAYGFIHAAHANILYDMNDLDTAETAYQHALKLGQRGGEFHILLKAYIGLAYTKIAQNDPESAFTYLEKASTLTEGGPFYDIFRATLALRRNDLQTASHWLDKHDLSVDALIANPKISYYHTPFIRFLIAQHRYTDAERLLSALTAWTTDHHLPYYTMRFNLFQSIIHYACDRTTRAFKTLEPILIWASAENSRRLFLDEPLAINLLQAIVHHASQSHTLSPQICTFVDELLDQYPAGQFPIYPSSTLVEDLSTRERDILPLLAAGLTNKAIAAELYLSAGTVKWHLKSIYRKLDVHSRTQAVAAARALNLLR